jgi:lipid-A-disaccharide synthase
MDEEVVTELIQDDCTTERIKEELTKILEGECRTKLLAQYDQLEQKLGGVGASQKTAQLIVKDLS